MKELRYNVTGMDCPSCVAKIESAARKASGVEAAKVSLTSQLLTVEMRDPDQHAPEMERAVTALGYKLTRLTPTSQPVADDDDRVGDYSHTTPDYRRALWIVVLLNIGMGVIEIIAGLAAGSQALKADALDFLGDGSITFLGLLAIGWNQARRARAALLQGLFLAALGIGVLAMTAYRVLVLHQPEADIMGIFAILALVTNVAAAAVLMPHRSGDANVRAVWLFSRNDAIGNLAVMVAAGLVAWTQTPWPDLVVAAVIAGLFLHSSWEILKDARVELRVSAD